MVASDSKKQKMSPLETALSAITDETKRSLYDVTIVCTTDDHQAEYWTQRLSEGLCSSSSSTADSPFPLVLAVSEDWAKGGAGNGVGTLYAYQKACRVAKEKHDIDLNAMMMDKKVSAALYHTAGKGTRLAPLPASENNNKPGVKLPVCHKLSDGSWAPITVLEAVVKQTGIYASSRKGRLSVFWGDQVFLPSVPFEYTPTHHIDIMCTLLGQTAPTAEEWVEKGLDKYGVIAVSKGAEKNAAQVEKVDHATAVKMLAELGDIGQVGPSLGSFSVSASMLNALCDEYSTELSSKTGKFDTDPHFWMPLTLSEENYISLMKQKGIDEDVSKAHHQRMAKMKSSFDLGGMGLFGAVDVGSEACWWDYGLLKLYLTNNMKLIDTEDPNADLLRKFMGITSRIMNTDVDSSKLTIDEKSSAFSCKISSGSISNSVLANVEAVNVHVDDAIVVNCTARKIHAPKGAILYNLVDESEEGIIAEEGAVIVSVTNEEGEQTILKSKKDICGGKAWKKVVEGNPTSFEDVMVKNMNANVSKIEKKRAELFRKASDSFDFQ
mmetsp:Transcript_5352/g.7348  ORF Transcript_5352/g.7348 Transcript_5352/m.7348 type:complete len:551 (-) Transcript_5352:202-1854(-)|eukprot:CAMPEP_0185726446 /NCGR_PEP_ID=MMETSP1171-20130828/2429_1 /TAXON_ID=374046 /ORGANISM="Helicotheca tamensis, Strain CCMP826" /LENGTH=550 /DNA_ID=CAMNT_0028394807 /DNA_START=112 /DNA_END=1764 /DNA_ORIENTATION=+